MAFIQILKGDWYVMNILNKYRLNQIWRRDQIICRTKFNFQNVLAFHSLYVWYPVILYARLYRNEQTDVSHVNELQVHLLQTSAFPIYRLWIIVGLSDLIYGLFSMISPVELLIIRHIE